MRLPCTCDRIDSVCDLALSVWFSRLLMAGGPVGPGGRWPAAVPFLQNESAAARKYATIISRLAVALLPVFGEWIAPGDLNTINKLIDNRAF